MGWEAVIAFVVGTISIAVAYLAGKRTKPKPDAGVPIPPAAEPIPIPEPHASPAEEILDAPDLVHPDADGGHPLSADERDELAAESALEQWRDARGEGGAFPLGLQRQSNIDTSPIDEAPTPPNGLFAVRERTERVRQPDRRALDDREDREGGADER